MCPSPITPTRTTPSGTGQRIIHHLDDVLAFGRADTRMDWNRQHAGGRGVSGRAVPAQAGRFGQRLPVNWNSIEDPDTHSPRLDPLGDGVPTTRLDQQRVLVPG